MSMGPSGGGGERFEPISNINITPLVDVSLVLVIIFMVTMPYMMEKAMNVGAQGASVSAEPSPIPVIAVEIDRSGVRIEGRASAIREIPAIVQRLIKEHGSTAADIMAGREVAHGTVVAVMDRIADAGIHDLNLRQPGEESGGR